MWQPGDVVALRGIYNQRVSYMQSAVVVHDTLDEVALVILPGAECAAPEGYMNGKHGASGHWDRWGEYEKENWQMQLYRWHTNRLLILLHPEKYYASYYFWQADNNQFLCYYINFQLPFHRSKIGFDSFDLELDLIVEPNFEWHWKDLDDYQRGIELGILRPQWVKEIDSAKLEIFEKFEHRRYPFDDTWLKWMPHPQWCPPNLPADWEKV
jgi:protein associated with RNAse G/E